MTCESAIFERKMKPSESKNRIDDNNIIIVFDKIITFIDKQFLKSKASEIEKN